MRFLRPAMMASQFLLLACCGLLSAQKESLSTPPGSIFIPPPQNLCISAYDRYYEREPGVYAYWAGCENGTPVQIFDYVGHFDFNSSGTVYHAWRKGTIVGGLAGPVPDSEHAVGIATQSSFIEGQGIPLNTHGGTVAMWLNADSSETPATAVYFAAVGGKSGASVGVKKQGQDLCIWATVNGVDGKGPIANGCSFQPNQWYRVALTWDDGSARLYVDGHQVQSVKRNGGLDERLFFYRLFPSCCVVDKQMTLAKVLLANEAWRSDEIAADFKPKIAPTPTGGVWVSDQKLGTIHEDVLGIGDFNNHLRDQGDVDALVRGLKEAGFASMRHSGGHPGIKADLADWHGGRMCTKEKQQTAEAWSTVSGDTLDNFMNKVALPLGLNVAYTVNYGTNPPRCDAGGDPEENGAALVRYVREKKYPVKYWEIGNELYSQSTETDFHSTPYDGQSFSLFEREFYDKIKAVDPESKIGIPVDMIVWKSQSGFDLPALFHAKYDAAIWHSYPMRDPITDGDTLYPERVSGSLLRPRAYLKILGTELLAAGHDPESIWITEWNGEVSGNKWSRQTTGAVEPLFIVSQLAEFMRAGVKVATWWVQGSDAQCSTLNYDPDGDSAYSWWRCGMTVPVYLENPNNPGEIKIGLHQGDLTPMGRAFQLMHKSNFIEEGEHMLETDLDVEHAPWLNAYAATHGKSYAVILINRDRDQSHTVPVGFAEKRSGQAVEMWSYGRYEYDAARAGDWTQGPYLKKYGSWSDHFDVTIQPWSINVLIFDPAGPK
jgi:hypothetical protein